MPIVKGKRMHVLFMLLADFANIDSGGKLNVIGNFGLMLTEQFPFSHAMMYLAIRIIVDPSEFDKEHKFTVALYDEDNNQVWGAPELSFKISAPEVGRVAEFTPILGIQGLEFSKP